MPAYPVRESDDNLNRIIGGWEARPHSLPWQLYVLLGTNLALTAAHCLVDQR
ncbi:Chymotrypsin-like elastase family member 2A [Trichinella sp. T9]|nr:Chymotrypsin-like elastase family member 2A [Trichinella sp. T9]